MLSNKQSRFSPSITACFVLSSVFMLLSIPFLDLTGIHIDAAYELAAFWTCSYTEFSTSFLDRTIPLMIMSYLGAPKTWLFQPILSLAEPSVVILRWPNVIIGTANILMFWILLKRVAGDGLHIFLMSLLLLTDASFLFCTIYDFGPVVLLHFFLLLGVLLLLRFHDSPSNLPLMLAFFGFGIALWQKALFLWILCGLGAGTLGVAWTRVIPLVTVKRVIAASLALCGGCAPLLWYNIATGGGTLQVSSVIAPETTLSQKFTTLARTIDGTAMSSFLIDRQGGKSSTRTPTKLQRLSIASRMGADEIQSNWMPYLLVAALLATPWITSSLYRRWSSFVIVYLVVTWFQMAILKKTGAAVHHVILLWPMGHLLIGIVASQLIAGIRWRRIQHLICMILIFAIGRNLLVLHSYHTDLSIYGTQPIWTDASDHFRSARLLARPSRVVAVDWGYAPTLCLLNRGRAEIIDLSYHLADPVATNTSLIKSLIDDRHSVFVGRPDNQQQFPGVQQRIDSIAAAMGRRRTTLATLDDRLSKMRFHLFRYVGGTTTQIERITSIDTANPNHAMRLQGFHEIEQGNFRWTQRSFSVLLDKPGDDAMQLMIVFSVPQSLISRLGSLKLRATVEGTSQSTPVITQPGQFRQIWKFPPCRDRQVTVQFELDNFLHAGAVELRELGLIVKSVELTSVY